MIDFGLLASAAVTMLAPVLRHLLKLGGEKAVEAAGEKVGEGVAGKLWGQLGPKVEAKKGAAEAAAELAADPADTDARELLETHLRQILKADPGLAAEVDRLVTEAKGGQRFAARLEGDGAIAQGKGAVAAGKGGIAVGGSVQGDIRSGRGED